MSNMRLLLYPFSILYDGITRVRNYMYDKEYFESAKFQIPLIVIGNLSVGGTGKTPHTELILSLLKDNFKPAVLSRGYGRKTKGYLLASENSTAAEIGDEPKQIKTHFPNIPVAVCEKRPLGVTHLLKEVQPEVIVLDDAFQHRAITGSLNIIITPHHNLFTRDFILPAGNLRESRSNKHRADIIIVSKCPADLTQKEKDAILSEINPSEKQEVYYSGIKYLPAKKISGNSDAPKSKKGILVTGIVNPAPLAEHLKSVGYELELVSYPDHYFYTDEDIQKIQLKLDEIGEGASIFTTSKDASKLKSLLQNHPQISAFEIPIGIQILFNEEPKFKQTIINHVSEISRGS